MASRGQTITIYCKIQKGYGPEDDISSFHKTTLTVQLTLF